MLFPDLNKIIPLIEQLSTLEHFSLELDFGTPDWKTPVRIGIPQGLVLRPMLFALLTRNHMMRFAER